MIEHHFFLIVFFGYFASLALYFLDFELQNTLLERWARRILSVSFAGHALFLVYLALNKSSAAIGFSHYVYAVSLPALGVPFYLEWRYKTKHLLLFSLPAVLFVSLLAMLVAHQQLSQPLPTSSAFLWVHIGFIFSGFACLVVAAASAVMYLWQSTQLKSKRPGATFLKLPALETLDRMNFRTLTWGVILFSMGTLGGLFWASKIPDIEGLLKDPKVITALLACPLYWFILALRLSRLGRGKKIALGTTLLFIIFFTALIGSYYCPSGFHNRGIHGNHGSGPQL